MLEIATQAAIPTAAFAAGSVLTSNLNIISFYILMALPALLAAILPGLYAFLRRPSSLALQPYYFKFVGYLPVFIVVISHLFHHLRWNCFAWWPDENGSRLVPCFSENLRVSTLRYFFVYVALGSCSHGSDKPLEIRPERRREKESKY